MKRSTVALSLLVLTGCASRSGSVGTAPGLFRPAYARVVQPASESVAPTQAGAEPVASDR